MIPPRRIAPLLAVLVLAATVGAPPRDEEPKPPPPEPPDGDAFHAHLARCVQCREHPFAPCEEGARLLGAGAR